MKFLKEYLFFIVTSYCFSKYLIITFLIFYTLALNKNNLVVESIKLKNSRVRKNKVQILFSTVC